MASADSASSSSFPSTSQKPGSAVREVRCFSTSDHSTPPSEEEKNVCWICLEGDKPSCPLERPCSCPRYCHLRCLARWQLQSAGTRRELHCDFCDSRLPDWRQALAFNGSVNAPAVMNVNFEGKTYSFEVKPGPAGYLQFTEAIRHAFQLPMDSELNITFTCDEPCIENGSLLTLQGPGAYDAAVYCASVSAARHQLGHRRTHSTTHSVNGRGASFMDRHGRHQRSQTLDTAMGPAIRTEDYVTQARNAHTRSRSIPAFPVSRSHRSHAGNSENGSAPPRKGWFKVVKRVRALYHRLTNK